MDPDSWDSRALHGFEPGVCPLPTDLYLTHISLLSTPDTWSQLPAGEKWAEAT